MPPTAPVSSLDTRNVPNRRAVGLLTAIGGVASVGGVTVTGSPITFASVATQVEPTGMSPWVTLSSPGTLRWKISPGPQVQGDGERASAREASGLAGDLLPHRHRTEQRIDGVDGVDLWRVLADREGRGVPGLCHAVAGELDLAPREGRIGRRLIHLCDRALRAHRWRYRGAEAVGVRERDGLH